MHPPEEATSDPPLAALVVDDDPSTRRLCRAMLEKEGWRVYEAADGAEAISCTKHHVLDVVIMDMLMPNVDGVEATRRLRADSTTKEILIIMLSAMGDSSDVVAGLEAGADEYLTKPLNKKEFIFRIRSMTRLRRAWREQQRSYNILGEQARSLNLLLDFSGALSHTEALDAILSKTIEVAATLTSCRRISIMFPDPKQDELRIVRSVGMDEQAADDIIMSVSSAIAETVFESLQPIVYNTYEEAAAFYTAHAPQLSPPPSGFPLPMASVAMCAAERTVGVLNAMDRIGHQPFRPQDLEYLNLISNYAASAIQNVLSRQARDEARDSIVVALAKLAEHRDDDTGKHLERVTMFCLMLAEELRRLPKYQDTIDADFLGNLKRAAPLHDIGKVAIPDSILLKPGKLTKEQMVIMRTHAAAGAETIRSVLARSPDSGFLKMAEEIAHGHHEWVDGSGYPRCLGGDDIPLAARILALADVYDALTTKRVYKEAMSHETAREIILGHRGTQFDPDIVDAFQQRDEEFQRLARELADIVPVRPPDGEPVANHGYRCSALVDSSRA